MTPLTETAAAVTSVDKSSAASRTRGAFTPNKRASLPALTAFKSRASPMESKSPQASTAPTKSTSRMLAEAKLPNVHM